MLRRIYFTSNIGFQNMFIYQPIFNALELNLTRVLNILLVGDEKVYIILNLLHYIVLFNFMENVLGIKQEYNLITLL